MPVIDLGGAGPIRCGRCRAYINPFFAFIDGGRSFQCNLCGMVNPTPSEYFCELDQNGTPNPYPKLNPKPQPKPEPNPTPTPTPTPIPTPYPYPYPYPYTYP